MELNGHTKQIRQIICKVHGLETGIDIILQDYYNAYESLLEMTKDSGDWTRPLPDFHGDAKCKVLTAAKQSLRDVAVKLESIL